VAADVLGGDSMPAANSALVEPFEDDGGSPV
jgi:hypothetical protein